MESGWSPRIIRICRGAVLVYSEGPEGGVGVLFKQQNTGITVYDPIAVTFDSITLRNCNIAVHRCKYSLSIGIEYIYALIV